MPLLIENETHWRTPDIKRLVKVCLDTVDADAKREYRVVVTYNKKRRKSLSVVDFDVAHRRKNTLVSVRLPKNGPKEPHRNGMLAIATATAAPGNGDLLAPSETFRLAHHLACQFAKLPGSLKNEAALTNENGWPVDSDRLTALKAACGTDMPPTWTKPENLLICKVQDPKKDGTYLAFVDKKQRAIKRADNAIRKEEKSVKAANRRLRDAKERKKKAIKALKDAEERRS